MKYLCIACKRAKKLLKRELFLLAFLPFLAFTSSKAADLASLKAELVKAFKEEYKGIEISELVLKPQGKQDLKSYEFLRIDRANLRRAQGFIKLVFRSKSTEKNVFFRYFIKARINTLIASKKILRAQALSPALYTHSSVDFEKVPRDYLYEVNEKLIAKRTIKKGKVLRRAYFKLKPLIAKKDRVYGVLKDGQISIMIELIALQSGQKGQLIRLKNKEGKTVQGRVLSRYQVELR